MDLLTKIVADGTLIVILIISAFCLLMKIRKDIWHYAPVLVMAGLTSLLAGKVMSLVYQPEFARPFIERGVTPGAAYIDNPGFPSDHVLLAVVAVVAVAMIVKNKRLVWFLSGLVVLMAVGRVLALVHTPTDVIFGAIAGLSGIVWYKKLTK